MYGEATVSWLPPGRTCTYVDVVPGQTLVVRPEWTRLGVLGVAIAGWPLRSYLRTSPAVPPSRVSRASEPDEHSIRAPLAPART